MSENTPEVAATPKRGVGTAIKEALLAGMSNQAALEAVKAEFPDSATTAQSVSWYRSELRKNGNPQNVPTATEAKQAAAKAAEVVEEAPEVDPLEE